jgi:hypothetical protein
MPRKERLNIYLEPATSRALSERATQKRLSKSIIVEAAVASLLSPDSSDQQEAALARRLDRLSRQLDRLERDQTITLEAIGLFIRAWLTATPPLAEAAQPAANAKGKERYASFIQTVGRRLQGNRKLSREIIEELESKPVED